MNAIATTPAYGLKLFKQGILLFWFAWFSIAFCSNLTDFLIAENIIGMIPFSSGNYLALGKVLSIYTTNTQFLNLLFILDITAQGLSALLFLLANYYFFRGNNYWPAVNIALGFSIFLWAMFILLEEVFIAYSFEGTHIGLFVFELISLLAMHLLPPGKTNG